MDGDSGFYRCHDRCGTRGIKKETLEQAVHDLLFDELLTLDNLCELRDAISEEAKGQDQGQDQLLEQLSGELKEIERQIGEAGQPAASSPPSTSSAGTAGPAGR
jgi:PHP family Zn ribbon phosphoesterase